MSGTPRARLSAALLMILIAGLMLGTAALWPGAVTAEGGAYQERPTVEPGRPTVAPPPADEAGGGDDGGGEEDAPEATSTPEGDGAADAPDGPADAPEGPADTAADAPVGPADAPADAPESPADTPADAPEGPAPTATPESLPRAGGGFGLAALLAVLGSAALATGAALRSLIGHPD